MTIPNRADIYTQGYGSKSENVEIPVYRVAAPTSLDYHHPVGKIWIDTVNNRSYTLAAVTVLQGISTATWVSNRSAFNITGAGITTLVGGTSVVTDPTVISSSKIFLAGSSLSGNIGTWSASVSTGSFTANSDNGADASSLFYAIVNAAP